METKLERINALVVKVKADCEQLEKLAQLTERGKGQLDVVKLIEEILKA